jgi:hypothetical protein
MPPLALDQLSTKFIVLMSRFSIRHKTSWHYRTVSCEILITFAYFVTLDNAKIWTVRGSNTGGGEIFRTPSRQALGPTQCPVHWVPFFPGVKRTGCDFNHQSPGSAKVKGWVKLYFEFPYRPSWRIIVLNCITLRCWSRLLGGLRCRPVASWLLGLRVRIPLRAWVFVSRVFYVLCR